jgi:sugar phosphate isomerase/epimerase
MIAVVITSSFNRRRLLAGAGLALAAGPLRAFKSHITKARISAITDEIGTSQAEAIDFAHEYGLQWVELRNVPETKKEFSFLSEPELKAWAAQLAGAKLKVSFLNTSLLKFDWPGMEPERPRKETDEQRTKREAANQAKWDRRKDDVTSALRAANILGVDKIRVFTGTRVANPESTYPLIVKTMEELIPLAEKAKVKLLIENENSQNIGTSAELKAILELLPSKTIGYNWDPGNAQSLQEKPWPDGYRQLPVSRMMNLQFKAKNVMLDSPDRIDWKAIMEALQKDNYQGELGLETHIFNSPAFHGTMVEGANICMRQILHDVGELS